MPYFLIKDVGAFGGRAEVARLAYRTRAEAQAALRLHRGRWRVVSALSPIDAEKLALSEAKSSVSA